MTPQIENDKNLIVVASVERYAQEHNIETGRAFELFLKRGIPALLRSQYEVLHTQALDEGFYFAQDVLERKERCDHFRELTKMVGTDFAASS